MHNLPRNAYPYLQEIADIATSQARLLEQQQVSRDKELLSVRAQLLDLQSASDEKALIGKLHRHIIQLQMSEGRPSHTPTPTPTVVWLIVLIGPLGHCICWLGATMSVHCTLYEYIRGVFLKFVVYQVLSICFVYVL